MTWNIYFLALCMKVFGCVHSLVWWREKLPHIHCWLIQGIFLFWNVTFTALICWVKVDCFQKKFFTKSFQLPQVQIVKESWRQLENLSRNDTFQIVALFKKSLCKILIRSKRACVILVQILTWNYLIVAMLHSDKYQHLGGRCMVNSYVKLFI